MAQDTYQSTTRTGATRTAYAMLRSCTLNHVGITVGVVVVLAPASSTAATIPSAVASIPSTTEAATSSTVPITNVIILIAIAFVVLRILTLEILGLHTGPHDVTDTSGKIV